MQQLRILAIAGLVAAILSCGNDGPITVRIGAEWSSTEAAEIAKSVDEWNAITTDDDRIVIRPDGDWLVEHRDPMVRVRAEGIDLGALLTTSGLVDVDPSTVHVEGWTWPHDRLVQLLPPDVPGGAHARSLHELGHVLGLRHTASGVMNIVAPNPDGFATFALTDVDVVECRDVRACD